MPTAAHDRQRPWKFPAQRGCRRVVDLRGTGRASLAVLSVVLAFVNAVLTLREAQRRRKFVYATTTAKSSSSSAAVPDSDLRRLTAAATTALE